MDPIQTKWINRTNTDALAIGSMQMLGDIKNEVYTRSIITTLEEKNTIAFVALIDGHNGHLCSDFVAEQFNEQTKSSSKNVKDHDVVRKMYMDIDRKFSEHMKTKGSVFVGSPMASCVSASISQEANNRFSFTLAHVGNCKCVLVKKDGTMELTADHSPYDQDEWSRIRKANGTIVKGVIDAYGPPISRCFGEFRFKSDPKLKLDEQKIICVPEVETYVADVGDFIVLFNHGMFEGMHDQKESVYNDMSKFVANMPLKKVPSQPGLDQKQLLDPIKIVNPVFDLNHNKSNLHALVVHFSVNGCRIESQYNLTKTECIPGPVPANASKDFIQAYRRDIERHAFDAKEMSAVWKEPQNEKEHNPFDDVRWSADAWAPGVDRSNLSLQFSFSGTTEKTESNNKNEKVAELTAAAVKNTVVEDPKKEKEIVVDSFSSEKLQFSPENSQFSRENLQPLEKKSSQFSSSENSKPSNLEEKSPQLYVSPIITIKKPKQTRKIYTVSHDPDKTSALRRSKRQKTTTARFKPCH